MTYVLVTALGNQPEAFASDLGDDLSLYLCYYCYYMIARHMPIFIMYQIILGSRSSP